MGKLVANYRKDVLDTIWSGINLTWNFRDQLNTYVKKLAQKVFSYNLD